MATNYKSPQSLIRKIKQTAPSRSIDGDRRDYYGGGSEETFSSFESVLIYIQKGLGNYTELVKEVVKLVLKVQKGGARKYPLVPMSFGEENTLTHERKYFDLGYTNDSYLDTEITKALIRLTTSKHANPAIIPELFPKTDIRSLYSGKTRVTEKDLLVIIGYKGQVFFDENIEQKLRLKIKKHILFVEIEENKVNWIYKYFTPTFINKIVNNMNLRKGDFKIGTFHGTLNPEKSSKEAKLRNALYLIGNLYLPISRTEEVSIRIIGYEIPIENRGKRIDLIGYDKDKNPWIIELKAHDSKEKISEIIQQINGYEIILNNHLDTIEKEFADKYFLNIALTSNIKKMILAPREFYKGQERNLYPKMDEIVLCSIARIKELFDSLDNFTLDSKLSNYDKISLKIENR